MIVKAIFVFFLVQSICANRVSLFTSGSKYLRYTDNLNVLSRVSLSFYNNTDSDMYETAWDLNIQTDGSFSISPILQPNISVKATEFGIEMGIGSKETSWILLPAGNSAFKIESKFYSGFFFGNEKGSLGLTREEKFVLAFSLQETKIPDPLLLLATDMTEYSINPVNLQSKFLTFSFSYLIFFHQRQAVLSSKLKKLINPDYSTKSFQIQSLTTAYLP